MSLNFTANKSKSIFVFFVVAAAFGLVACGDDSSSGPSEKNLESSYNVDAESSNSDTESSGATLGDKNNKSSNSSSSSTDSAPASSSIKNHSQHSSSDNDNGNETDIEFAVASTIAYYCISDSLKADSLIKAYQANGNFGEMNTTLADCAYLLSLDHMDGDCIMPSELERVHPANFYWQDFREAFYKFWEDDFGVGLCNKDSMDVVKPNLDSLSSSPKYFICTDRRVGYTSDINWVKASSLQVNTYGLVCDSADYRGITGYLDSALYVCDHGNWRTPMTVEIENGLCEEKIFGEVKQGNVFEYICDANEWKMNEIILTDPRDNKEYRTTHVAGLQWMMENFAADTAKFLWDEITADFCPDGWRIPTQDEWGALFKAMQGLASNASTMKLISYAGHFNNWWTSTESGDSVYVAHTFYTPMDYSQSLKFEYDSYGVSLMSKNTKYGNYIRCVKDE